ncbi:hypothetical protein [Lacipirellula sp.]|uniref:hypothetical protein n=1 Tax=Lacipirellula sp. TaxID=2691419 RepID=UPI003D1351AE
MANIPLCQQIKAVEREIRLRGLVYPRWVKERRMKQVECDHEIAAMNAVLHTLMALDRAQAGEQQRSLFEELTT